MAERKKSINPFLFAGVDASQECVCSLSFRGRESATTNFPVDREISRSDSQVKGAKQQIPKITFALRIANNGMYYC